MSHLPQIPHPGNHAPSPRGPNRWIDLIAFLAVLALGGALILAVPGTAFSIATTCVALGGLYRLWRSHSSDDDK